MIDSRESNPSRSSGQILEVDSSDQTLVTGIRSGTIVTADSKGPIASTAVAQQPKAQAPVRT